MGEAARALKLPGAVPTKIRSMARNRVVTFSLLALLLLLAAFGAWWWLRDGGDAAAYRTARIERGPLQAAVAATGTIAPVIQVQVGTQVSGQIKELFADFNSPVRAGQLLARLDPQSFEYKLRQVQADLDAARASVLNAQANAGAAQAAVARARVDVAEARRTLARNEELLAQNFISSAQVDTSRALVASQEATLKAAEAQAQVAQAQIATAEATVKQRQALVAQANIDIERTEIRSPVDGVVIKRSVELGQTVAASLQAPELFVIAQNLSDMQVQAAIDEADISRVRVGQKATFTVDAFPGRAFEGTVSQVRQAATNTQNVITYTAVVAFTPGEVRLLPGMTANVKLVTDTRTDALKVPNAALRVRLPGSEVATAASAPSAPADVGMANGEPAPRAASSPDAARRRQGGHGASNTASGRGRIYLIENGQPRAYRVRLGISDGTMTEIVVPPGSPDAERVTAGAEVIVGTLAPGSGSRTTGPRMMF
jgi:HlyD family secretion protein